MQVGTGGMAGEAELRERLAFAYAVADGNPHAAGLEVLVEGIAVSAEVEDDVVAAPVLERQIRMRRKRLALLDVVAYRRDHGIGHGQHLRAVRVPVGDDLGVALCVPPVGVQLYPVDRVAAGDHRAPGDGVDEAAMPALPRRVVDGRPVAVAERSEEHTSE